MKKVFIIIAFSIFLVLAKIQVRAEEAATSPYCLTEEQRKEIPSYRPFAEHGLTALENPQWQTTGKELDPSRPQLKGLTGSTPTLVNMYTFTTKPGESTAGWGKTQAVGIGVSAGQNIYVPPSGRTIGSGMQVLVSNINPSSGTISLQYTLDAGFSGSSGPVNRYDLHLSGVAINQQIIDMYNSRKDGELPALPAGYVLGTATGGELKVSMADSGTFMDLTEQNDFWAGDVNVLPNPNLIMMAYNKCPVYNPPAATFTCKKPLTGADNFSCIAGCTGVTYTSVNPITAILGFFTQTYEIPVKLADGNFKAQISDYKNPSNVELYSNNTTPTAYLAGRVDYVNDPNKFWTETKKGLKNENPPTYNTSMANFINPDMYYSKGEAYFRNAFMDKMDEKSQVQILVRNAADVDGTGGQAPGLIPPEKQAELVGVRVEPAKNCTSGCWVPKISICKPGRDFNCGGGGVAVYVQNDPNGPAAGTAIQAGDYGENFGPKNEVPIFSKGYSIYKGSVQSGPSANSAIVNNVGHDCVENDGSVTRNGHCSVGISWTWCTQGLQACYSGYGTPPTPNGVPDKSGGPIITAQDGMTGTRAIAAAYFQNLFAPPGIIYAEETIPGIAKNEVFSEKVLAMRQEYREQIEKNQLAENLSEEEKIQKIYKQVEADQKKHNKRIAGYQQENDSLVQAVEVQKQEALKKVEEYRDKELSNTKNQNTKAQNIIFNPPANSCPENLNINKAPICPNDSAQKPDTTIYLPPRTGDVTCVDGKCGKPGEREYDASALVFTAFSSGQCVTCGTGFTQSILAADAIDDSIHKYTKTENLVSLDLGNQNLYGGVLTKMFRTPKEGAGDKDRTRDVNPAKAAPRPFNALEVDMTKNPLLTLGTLVEVADKWEEPDEGSSIGCQKLLREFTLTPDDKQAQNDYANNVEKCFLRSSEAVIPPAEELPNFVGHTGYYNYTFTDEDYFSKTPLDTPISGRAKYYSSGWGENMEETYAWKVADKSVCPDCDGYAAMLRAGDKGRVVCINNGKKTYKALVVDVAGRGDIPGLLAPSNNWVIDVSHGLAVKMGMASAPGVNDGGPMQVTVSDCN